jgi:hypothetical protein
MRRYSSFDETQRGCVRAKWTFLKTLFTTTSYAKTLDDGLGLDEVIIDRELRHLGRGSMGLGQKLIFDKRI